MYQEEVDVVVYETPYEEPANNEEELYGQLSALIYDSITPECITLGRQLGKG